MWIDYIYSDSQPTVGNTATDIGPTLARSFVSPWASLTKSSIGHSVYCRRRFIIDTKYRNLWWKRMNNILLKTRTVFMRTANKTTILNCGIVARLVGAGREMQPTRMSRLASRAIEVRLKWWKLCCVWSVFNK